MGGSESVDSEKEPLRGKEVVAVNPEFEFVPNEAFIYSLQPVLDVDFIRLNVSSALPEKKRSFPKNFWSSSLMEGILKSSI